MVGGGGDTLDLRELLSWPVDVYTRDATFPLKTITGPHRTTELQIITGLPELQITA